jgi:hypothetical protein
LLAVEDHGMRLDVGIGRHFNPEQASIIGSYDDVAP